MKKSGKVQPPTEQNNLIQYNSDGSRLSTNEQKVLELETMQIDRFKTQILLLDQSKNQLTNLLQQVMFLLDDKCFCRVPKLFLLS